MRDLTGYVQQGRMAAFIGDNVVVKGVRRKAQVVRCGSRLWPTRAPCR